MLIQRMIIKEDAEVDRCFSCFVDTIYFNVASSRSLPEKSRHL